MREFCFPVSVKMSLSSDSGISLETLPMEKSVYNGGFPSEVHDSIDAPFEITKQGIDRTFHHYTWKFSHEKVTVDGKRKVLVKSQMTGQYNFPETVQLTVYLSNETEDVKKQVFNLSKVDEQTLEILCHENRFNYCNFDDLRVKAFITMKDFQYIPGNWDVKNSFYNPKRAHDRVLILNGVRFYVHSHYLAAWSRYFDSIFFGAFKENGEKDIIINDVEPSEFDVLLSLMHPNTEININNVNVVSLLKLADRFEVPSIMAGCGKYLTDFNKSPDITLMDRLEYADTYNLAGLQIACISRLRGMLSDERLQFYNANRKRFRELHHNTLKNLF